VSYRSRKITQIRKDESMPEDQGYCRMCRRVQPLSYFHSALDERIDTNKHLSICKFCCDQIFNEEMERNKGSLELAVLSMCRILNMRYDEQAIESAKKHIETRGSDPKKFIGFYKAKLVTVSRTSVSDGASSLDLGYRDNPTVNLAEQQQEVSQENEFDEDRDLKLFWGTDDRDEIEFLEREFISFKQTHKADTYAEITLLKQVCRKLWDIEKDRKVGKSTDASTKQLMELMKNLAISPSMSNAAMSGKGVDTLGTRIKDIENLTPAEWVKDKSVYRDVDDLEAYTQKYIVSPLRSFVSGSKEFTVENTESEIDDED